MSSRLFTRLTPSRMQLVIRRLWFLPGGCIPVQEPRSGQGQSAEAQEQIHRPAACLHVWAKEGLNLLREQSLGDTKSPEGGAAPGGHPSSCFTDEKTEASDGVHLSGKDIAGIVPRGGGLGKRGWWVTA